ncbi:MAG: TatD family hydrolase [Bacillota bacterium]|nr:MAG: hydrolase TatD [Bacillota bacterium]
MLFNTHSHVDTARQFDADRDEVMARAREMGVSQLMVIGFERALIPITLAFAERHDGVWAAVGIHPTSALEWGPEAEAEIRAAARHPRVRAVGEVGLDYYWKDRAPFPVQQDVFRQQIRLARELGLPLVIHNRDAHADVLRILEEERADEVGGIMHCFSGDWAMAERCLELNFYIGIGGTVTYKNNPTLREVARRLPLDRIVLETDDPYLAPVPHRGKRNEPGYVRIVAEFLAELRETTLEAIAEATTANARRALRLDA